MRFSILLFLLFISELSFAQSTDSLIQKQKGWYVSAAITRTFIRAPLLNYGGGNPNIYIAHPATFYAGYRLAPKLRAQAGLSYLSVKFDMPDFGFHGRNNYSANDRGQFLNFDLQLKGYALNQRYHLQPYLALGVIARNYWLQQNHIIYNGQTTEEIARINNRYNGTLFYGTINPGLQLRFSRCFEVFTEYNARFNLGTYNSIWPKGTTFFSGISGGLTYHLPNR
jgi:hypothetical protein